MVDHERVLGQLKARLQARNGDGDTKDSWGRRELLQIIGELEAENTLEEGLPEKVLRLHGTALSRELLTKGADERPTTEAAAGGNGNGH